MPKKQYLDLSGLEIVINGLRKEIAQGDSQALALISSVKNTLDTLIGSDDTTQVIDTFNEIIAFLDTFKNNDSLASIIATLRNEIQSWVLNQSYLVASDIEHKADRSEVIALDTKIGDLDDLDDLIKADSFAEAVNNASKHGKIGRYEECTPRRYVDYFNNDSSIDIEQDDYTAVPATDISDTEYPNF